MLFTADLKAFSDRLVTGTSKKKTKVEEVDVDVKEEEKEVHIHTEAVNTAVTMDEQLNDGERGAYKNGEREKKGKRKGYVTIQSPQTITTRRTSKRLRKM